MSKFETQWVIFVIFNVFPVTILDIKILCYESLEIAYFDLPINLISILLVAYKCLLIET